MQAYDSKHIQNILTHAECLYDEQQTHQALDQMAREITSTFENLCPLVLCVMTGALIMTGHLLTRLKFDLELDYIHATRYRGTNRGGDLHWLVEPRKSLHDRHILIIDDIMDGGLTLSAIMDYCKNAQAKTIRTAVLVNKKRQREAGCLLEPDFVGLETEDRYLFGFGLDYHEFLRNIPGIYAVKD